MSQGKRDAHVLRIISQRHIRSPRPEQVSPTRDLCPLHDDSAPMVFGLNWMSSTRMRRRSGNVMPVGAVLTVAGTFGVVDLTVCTSDPMVKEGDRDLRPTIKIGAARRAAGPNVTRRSPPALLPRTAGPPAPSGSDAERGAQGSGAERRDPARRRWRRT